MVLDDPHSFWASDIYPYLACLEFPFTEFWKTAQIFYILSRDPRPTSGSRNSCRAVDLHFGPTESTSWQCCTFPSVIRGDMTQLCCFHEAQRACLKQAISQWSAHHIDAEQGGKALLVILYSLKFQEGYFSALQAGYIVNHIDHILNLAVHVEFIPTWELLGFRNNMYPAEEIETVIQQYNMSYKQAWHTYLTQGNPFTRTEVIKIELIDGSIHIFDPKLDMLPVFNSLETSGILPQLWVLNYVFNFRTMLDKTAGS